jgi:hypothetical protein
MIAKASEKMMSECPVISSLLIKMILYKKRNANTTQMIEMFPRIISL